MRTRNKICGGEKANNFERVRKSSRIKRYAVRQRANFPSLLLWCERDRALRINRLDGDDGQRRGHLLLTPIRRFPFSSLRAVPAYIRSSPPKRHLRCPVLVNPPPLSADTIAWTANACSLVDGTPNRVRSLTPDRLPRRVSTRRRQCCHIHRVARSYSPWCVCFGLPFYSPLRLVFTRFCSRIIFS